MRFISKQSRVFSAYKSENIDILEGIIKMNPDKIGFDFETTGLDVRKLDVVLLGIQTSIETYIIDFTSYTPEEVSPYILRLKDSLWIAHNAKFDIGILFAQFDLPIHEFKFWCTMVSSQIRYNGADIEHGYADCVNRHFKVDISKEIRSNFINRDMTLPIMDEEIAYLENDLKYLIPLQERHEELLDYYNMRTLMSQIEGSFLPALVELELEGVRIDTNKWLENSKNFKRESEELKEAITKDLKTIQEDYNLADVTKTKKTKGYGTLDLFNNSPETYSTEKIIEKINPNSTVQLQKIINKLGVDITDTNAITLEKTLLQLEETHKARPLIENICKLRKKEKLVSTYGESFLRHLDFETFKIHTEYTQAWTDTGRLSSRKPNLQNIPATDDFRACFIPDSTDYKFVTIDFSQQELRVAAAYSEDTILIANFKEGLDLHSYLAQESFRRIGNDKNLIVTKKINSHLRDLHKPVLFGFIYGATASRVASVLNVHKEKGEIVIQWLKQAMPRLTRYQSKIKLDGTNKGRVFDGTSYNRMKQFFVWKKVQLKDYQIETQASNFPIQGSCASMTKEALTTVYHYIKDINIDAAIKLQVHDELVFQVHNKDLHHAQEFKRIMEDVGTKYLRGVLTMEASINIADTWKK